MKQDLTSSPKLRYPKEIQNAGPSTQRKEKGNVSESKYSVPDESETSFYQEEIEESYIGRTTDLDISRMKLQGDASSGVNSAMGSGSKSMLASTYRASGVNRYTEAQRSQIIENLLKDKRDERR